MDRIGIFGGSFDPVHNGHIGIAKNAIDELSLDALFVIPAAVSPFKVSNYPTFSDEARLELLRIAFEDINKVIIDSRELTKGGISYAIDTVREIIAEYPGSELFFIIGEDSLSGLPRWKEYDELKKLCSFKVCPRTKESSTEIRRLLSNGERLTSFVGDRLENVIIKLWGAK